VGENFDPSPPLSFGGVVSRIDPLGPWVARQGESAEVVDVDVDSHGRIVTSEAAGDDATGFGTGDSGD
jgi:hypothetical protein